MICEEESTGGAGRERTPGLPLRESSRRGSPAPCSDQSSGPLQHGLPHLLRIGARDEADPINPLLKSPGC